MMNVLNLLAARRGDEQFVVLTRADVVKIDQTARRIVDEMGFRVEHPGVLADLRKHGCRVDGNVVRITGAQVDALLARTPKVAGDGRHTGPGWVRVGYFANQVYDADLDQVRYPTRQDLDQATIVGLSMPEVRRCDALFEPKDAPGFEDVVMLDVIARRSPKPKRCDVLRRENIPVMLRMAQVVAGSMEEMLRRDILVQNAFVTSPLKYDYHTLDFGLAAAAAGIRVRFGASMNVAGVSAPVTFAGTMAMSLAENYTGLLLSDVYGQRWNPGMAPIVMDQMTGASLYASPERFLLGAATRDLYRYLGIDLQFGSGIGHSTTTDASRPGLQAGIEKAQSAMLNLLAGYPPVITHGGMMGPGGLVASTEQIVIDCELVSMINRIARGVEVNDETLAFDLIREMGFDGQYIEQEHTAAHFREELWLPRILQRPGPGIWNETKPDMLQEAKKKVKQILAENDPRALDAGQEKELDRIVRQAMGA